MSLDALISGLTKALEAHTAALNQFSRAIEIHAEALKGSHKADEMMAEVKAEKKDEPGPEEKKATAKPKKAAKKEPEPEEKKATAKPKKAAKKDETSTKPKKAAKKEPEPEETHIEPEEKVVEIHQDNPKVQAAKELSNMLTSAREKGPAVYRQFFRAAKSTLEEAGVSRLQEVPDDNIDEVMGKLREAYDLYVKENEDAEIV